MVKYASNPRRGASSSKSGGRLKDLEEELFQNAGARNDEIGSANGSAQMPEQGAPDKQQRVQRARQFFITQGKRKRPPEMSLNWYAASAYRPENVTSYWQKAMDAEHDRHELPDVYSDYYDNPTTNQYGLVSTAVKNFSKSRRRLSDYVAVGV